MTVHVTGPEPERPRRRGMSMGVVVALVAGIGTAVWVALGGSEDDATPTPDPSPTQTRAADAELSAAQETALVYHDWERGLEVAACFTEAGYPLEPQLLYEHDRVPRVAGVLGVEAATDRPELPLPGLRWNTEHRDQVSSEAAFLTDPADPDNCLPTMTVLDVHDAEIVTALSDEARDDDAFHETVAEHLWAHENPGAVALGSARVWDGEATVTDPAAQARWRERLDALMGRVGTAAVATRYEVTDHYAQVAALSPHGGVVVIRVSTPDFDLVNAWDDNWDVQCEGDVHVGAGWEPGFDRAALGDACAALP